MDHQVTSADIAKAKSVDLCDVATSLGYTVVRVGSYHTLKEMDSVRIYNRSSWYRWSDGSGGSQIDFLLNFTGMDFVDAVKYLIDHTYEVLPPRAYGGEKEKRFTLPSPSSNNEVVITYLTKFRGLSLKTVRLFIDKGYIYQSEDFDNIVFTERDKNGVPRGAMLRSTDDKKNFKGEAKGSDKSYGFRFEAGDSDTVRVFEAPIDLMSFYDATGLKSDHLIALGGTWDGVLDRFLDDHPEVRTIILCLDNDEPGIEAAEKSKQKYEEKGYDVKNLGSPKGYKDYNEWLVSSKMKARQSPSINERALSR